MPVANSNAFSRRIEAGSILTINDGSTTWTIVAAEQGYINWSNGGYDPIEWTDRGVLQDPLEGDERPTELEMKFKWTGGADANDIEKFLSTRDTTTGKMKQFSIVLKVPTVKGGATGQQGTFAKSFVLAGGLKVTAGDKYDVLDVKMKDNEVRPTWATY